jgi:peroxiredoxin
MAVLILPCADGLSNASERLADPDVVARPAENDSKPAVESRQKAVPSKPETKKSLPPAIPQVNLSDEIRANCVVKVGDALPNVKLPDRDGKKVHPLADLYGKKLTIVCLWTGASPELRRAATPALKSLPADVAKPFRRNGVQVIGIEVTGYLVDDAEEWSDIQETAASLPFPCLEDPKGLVLSGVCKDDKMPRVYLLDAKGRILWFDVGFSPATKSNLVRGIRVALGELK